MGWLAAINTANEVITTVLNSDLFGAAPGAKANREILGWLAGGVAAGGVGAGLTAFIPRTSGGRREPGRQVHQYLPQPSERLCYLRFLSRENGDVNAFTLLRSFETTVLLALAV